MYAFQKVHSMGPWYMGAQTSLPRTDALHFTNHPLGMCAGIVYGVFPLRGWCADVHATESEAGSREHPSIRPNARRGALILL